MAMSHWILPRADSACGKVFHPDRRAAEGHRVALEFWIRATGRTRKDSRLTVYRCKRCGGFHIANKKIEPKPAPSDPFTSPYESKENWTAPDLDGEENADRPDDDVRPLTDFERLDHVQDAGIVEAAESKRLGVSQARLLRRWFS
jgi:hypothetical protein